MEWLNNVLVRVMDPALGWLLWLPRDMALVAVGVATSLVLTLTRKWFTDQDWLRRADADRKRLKLLIRNARKDNDMEALKRYRQTMAQIQMRSMKCEGRPLLLALLPVALLAAWCFARLGYAPPGDGEEVTIKACFAHSAVGCVTHLAPTDGIDSAGGWVRAVEPDRPPEIRGWWRGVNAWVQQRLGRTPALQGAAVWTIRAKARPEPYVLRIVFAGDIYACEFLAGDKRYAPTSRAFASGPVRSLEVQLRPLKLFGVVPGLDCIGVPPWMVAYLLIALPCVTLCRRLFAVY